jgi:hypothetical protein
LEFRSSRVQGLNFYTFELFDFLGRGGEGGVKLPLNRPSGREEKIKAAEKSREELAGGGGGYGYA